MSAKDLETLHERLRGEGVPRLDDALLREAVTHRSFASEHPGTAHFERLEFLGDAVVNLAAANLLFRRFTLASEGQLSRLRIELVQAPTLARAAGALELASYARLGVGEERAGGRAREHLAADLFEAVVGAVHVGHGFSCSEAFARRCLEPLLPDERGDMVAAHDDKGRLQRWTQSKMSSHPSYQIVNDRTRAEGEAFVARVTLPDGRVAEGAGRRKKLAEQAAAREALARYAEPVAGGSGQPADAHTDEVDRPSSGSPPPACPSEVDS